MELHAKMMRLADALGEEPAASLVQVGEEFTIARIRAFHSAVTEFEAEQGRRQTRIETAVATARGIWEDLGRAEPTSEYERVVAAGVAGVGLTLPAIEALEAYVADLAQEKGRREVRIQALGEAITALWQRLQTPVEEQTRFLESHNGVGDATLAAVEAYLHAKHAEFQARLADLIDGARTTIRSLWAAIHCDEADGVAEFPGVSVTDRESLSESLFSEHETYIAVLRERQTQLEPILKLVALRAELLAEKTEYETIIANPARLLSRGAGAARLREEKLERRVKKELPKTIERLRKLIDEYEAERPAAEEGEGATAAPRQVRFHGRPLREVLADEDAGAAPNTATASTSTATTAAVTHTSSAASGGGGAREPKEAREALSSSGVFSSTAASFRLAPASSTTGAGAGRARPSTATAGASRSRSTSRGPEPSSGPSTSTTKTSASASSSTSSSSAAAHDEGENAAPATAAVRPGARARPGTATGSSGASTSSSSSSATTTAAKRAGSNGRTALAPASSASSASGNVPAAPVMPSKRSASASGGAPAVTAAAAAAAVAAAAAAVAAAPPVPPSAVPVPATTVPVSEESRASAEAMMAAISHED